jgi:hypothetical protein
LCRFCYSNQEFINHLFFHCSFCRRIWCNFMASCLVPVPCVDWVDVVNWSICTLKDKSRQAILCKLCLATVVYHLWRQRNELCHGNTPYRKRLLELKLNGKSGRGLCIEGSSKKTLISVRLVNLWKL